MKTIHLLITGPIRPSLEFVIFNLNNIKSKFKNTITHLLYWDTNNESDVEQLKKHVDHLYAVKEPDDNEIIKQITNRTGQQNALKTIEHWTSRIYKMFYGIRKIVDFYNFKEDDIIVRIRTDLYFEHVNDIEEIFSNITPNSYYFCPRKCGGNSCDWFGLSDFTTFKKIWYYKDDTSYNNAIGKSWNAEKVLTDNAKTYNINLFDINSKIKMALCRHYKDKIPTLDFRHN